MRLVDAHTVAVYLGVTTRTIRRKVASGELKPMGQFGKGSHRGRPGWFFDLDNLRGELTEDPPTSDIGT